MMRNSWHRTRRSILVTVCAVVTNANAQSEHTVLSKVTNYCVRHNITISGATVEGNTLMKLVVKDGRIDDLSIVVPLQPQHLVLSKVTIGAFTARTPMRLRSLWLEASQIKSTAGLGDLALDGIDVSGQTADMRRAIVAVIKSPTWVGIDNLRAVDASQAKSLFNTSSCDYAIARVVECIQTETSPGVNESLLGRKIGDVLGEGEILEAVVCDQYLENQSLDVGAMLTGLLESDCQLTGGAREVDATRPTMIFVLRKGRPAVYLNVRRTIGNLETAKGVAWFEMPESGARRRESNIKVTNRFQNKVQWKRQLTDVRKTLPEKIEQIVGCGIDRARWREVGMTVDSFKRHGQLTDVRRPDSMEMRYWLAVVVVGDDGTVVHMLIRGREALLETAEWECGLRIPKTGEPGESKGRAPSAVKSP